MDVLPYVIGQPPDFLGMRFQPLGVLPVGREHYGIVQKGCQEPAAAHVGIKHAARFVERILSLTEREDFVSLVTDGKVTQDHVERAAQNGIGQAERRLLGLNVAHGLEQEKIHVASGRD